MDRTAQLKQVYLTMEKLQAKLEALQHAQTEPIAVVGMSCRYPNGANSPEAFWELLRDGRDGITEVPPGRWDARAYYDPQPDRTGKIATRWGGFLDNVAAFDARFFAIAPREAAQMDPQQRLLLEVAVEALESAGQPVADLAGSATAVYVGMLNSEYGWLQFQDLASLDAYSGTGTSHSVASGRLSHSLGLQGPSVTLDTACSSSLVAIHLACQGLRNREFDMALAGGVSLILSPLALMPFSRMGLLASDGRCKTLDAGADGFGSGEGCALLVLKRLSDAQAAGDPILALIRGSAVNQDGRTNVLSAPNGRAQEAVIRKALENARLEPAALSLVELHGTGTSLGDPIETDALRAVFGIQASRGQAQAQPTAAGGPVYLGAVKSNIGHTGAAAGIAGVIKAILALRHDTVPPNLHFHELNPHVNLNHTRFAIPTQPTQWPRGDLPRFAGISAFGWSGTNAHLILSDPPLPTPAAAGSLASPALAASVQPDALLRPLLLPLSAHSDAALRELTAAWRDHLRSPSGQAQALANLAYTAAVRRSHHPFRLAAVGATQAQLAERLHAYLEQPDPAGVVAGRHYGARRRKLVFVFSPHGAEWLGMGRELWRQAPVFREALAACQAAMRPYTDWSIEAQLHSDDGGWLERIDILQPVLFALQVALTALWRSWGVEPDAVVGHSMGEVAAAHVAGVLSLEAAARIICRRTQLLRTVSGQGTMGVVELSLQQAQAAIAPFGERLTIAAGNSPRSTILSGEPAAMEALFDQLQARDVFCGWGVADVASHGPGMAALGADLRQAIGEFERLPTQLPIYSTVTGGLDDGGQFSADYWVRHLNQPVLFAETVRQLAESGHDLFLEIGPGPVLSSAIEEGLHDLQLEGQVVPSLRRDAGDYGALLESLGRLYTLGYPVKWNKLYPAGAVMPVPAYPWQRERYWLAAPAGAIIDGSAYSRGARGASAAGALLGDRLEVAGEPRKVIWKNVYDGRVFPHLLQHRLFGRPVWPASAFLELALTAAEGQGNVSLTDVTLSKTLTLSEAAPWTEGQCVLERQPNGSALFRLYSRTAGRWQPHAAGTIASASPAGEARASQRPLPGRLSETLPDHILGPDLYRGLATLGIDYGRELQGVAELWWGRDEALARVQLAERWGRELVAGARPAAALEPALQTFAWLVARIAGEDGTLYTLTAIDGVTWSGTNAVPAWAYVQLTETGGESMRGRAELFDADGSALLVLEGLRFAAVSAAHAEHVADWLYQVSWEAADAPADPAPLAGQWLIFADDQGAGAALAALIAQDGGQALMVRPGDSLLQSPEAWRLRPAAPEDYQTLFHSIPVEGLRGIVHLWSLSSAAAESGAAADLDGRLMRHAAAVMTLVQAIKRAAPEATIPLWLVTAGAQPVAGSTVYPDQAPLWGLGYVLAEEHHELWGGLIDCDPAGDPAATAGFLRRELAAGRAEDRIAFRGEQRFVARLSRPELTPPGANTSDPLPADAARPSFRPDGAYLITGGFGDIAFTVARWAAEHGARRLILLGRSELPPRSRWRTLDPASPAGRRARAVQELEALGAAVHWAAVDVGDAAALAGFLDNYAAEGWPAIQGVIHSAAVIEDGLLVELDAASLRRVAHPKATAAWLLHQYFLDKPLDFFLLFSSSGSLLGAAGQANYAAANAYLDALAHVRRAAGQPALSINWGFWENLGFATTPGGRRAVAYMATFGMTPFKAEEALETLDYLMTRPDLTQVAAPQVAAPQVAAMKVDWQRWRRHSRLVGVPPFLRQMDQAEAGEPSPAEPADIRAQLVELEPGPLRLRRLQDFVRGQLASALHIDPATIDPETPLGSLGIDSFSAIELRNRLERSLGLQLSATLAWNYPTIAALAPFLADKMGLAVTVPVPTAAAVASPVLDDDLSAFLDQAVALSDDELRRLLSEGLSDE